MNAKTQTERNSLDGHKLKYEKLPSESKKLFGLARGRSRTGARAVGHALSSASRKVVRVAPLRILARLRNVERILAAPAYHDDKHGLEQYIRDIVKDEKRRKKHVTTKNA